MKFAFRGVSSAALMLGIYGGAGVAQAQTPQTVTTTQTAQAAPQTPATAVQTPAAGAQAPADKVVITGSLIATTPEDAPKPVEVYTAKDLQEQGSPSVSDFVRSLTVSAPS